MISCFSSGSIWIFDPFIPQQRRDGAECVTKEKIQTDPLPLLLDEQESAEMGRSKLRHYKGEEPARRP
jgi:hypothetical protein